MPTHTAYAVPTGRPRIAYASPPMLSARAATNTAVGASRVNPSDRPRAVAQTASRTPDRTRTSQYTEGPPCRSSAGRGVGIRREVAVVVGGQRVRPAAQGPHAALGARRGEPPGQAFRADAERHQHRRDRPALAADHSDARLVPRLEQLLDRDEAGLRVVCELLLAQRGQRLHLEAQILGQRLHRLRA